MTGSDTAAAIRRPAAGTLLAVALAAGPLFAQSSPPSLASWNDTVSRQAILAWTVVDMKTDWRVVFPAAR